MINNEQIIDIEPRIRKLEDSVGSVIEILKKIEIRLVGTVDNDSVGLFSDFRQSKIDILNAKTTIIQLELEIKNLRENILFTKDIIKDVSELKSSIKELTRYKWIILGAAAVIGFILNYIFKFWDLIKK